MAMPTKRTASRSGKKSAREKHSTAKKLHRNRRLEPGRNDDVPLKGGHHSQSAA